MRRVIAGFAAVFALASAFGTPSHADGMGPPTVAVPDGATQGAVTGSGFPAGGKIFDVDRSQEPWVATFNVNDAVRIHACGSDTFDQLEVFPGSSVTVARGQWLEMWSPSIRVWSSVLGADRCPAASSR
jgi:hypothetical protein